MLASSKEKIAALLYAAASRSARAVQALIVSAILVSVLATILETVPRLQSYGSLFDRIELVCTFLFTAEVLLRIWSANGLGSPYVQRRSPRLSYLLSPGGVVDLLAIVPCYLGANTFIVVRSFRLLRVFRLAKLARYSAALGLLAKAIRMRRRELTALAIVGALTILISATLVYSAEHEAQPNAFASMPDALWWALSTLTTVGYGDIYPVTALGRVCASVIMILGIGLVALPTGLVGSAFYELTQHRVCPHCGREVAEPHGPSYDEESRDRQPEPALPTQVHEI
ncbi:MAG: ion transporter [Polyangia bacterium]|jgi:voltage-gated potassium channel